MNSRLRCDEIMCRLFGIVTVLFWMDILAQRILRGGVDGLTLAPVYWNSSNPMFKPSINSPVIDVQLRDEIDFICPFDVSNGTDVTAAEYYVIYQVSKQEYDSCSLSTEARKPLLIVNCSAPETKRRFTVIFEPYQSIPNVPEYKIGNTYYYTTTSTGRNDGLSNPRKGACDDYNMKLAVYICCPTTVTPPSTASTTTTTPFRPLVPQSSTSGTDSRNSQAKPTDQRSMPSTYSSTTTTTTTTPPTIMIDGRTDPASRIESNPTLKNTQIPQPSYQQTANGCRRATRSPFVIATTTATTILIVFYSLWS